MLVYTQYRLYLSSLAIYRNILHDPALTALQAWLESNVRQDLDYVEICNRYHQFCFELLRTERCFSCHLQSLILEDDNVFSRTAEKQGEIGPELRQSAARDLDLLQRVTGLDFAELAPQSVCTMVMNGRGCKGLEHDRALLEGSDWALQIDQLIEHYRANSRGIMARYQALRWDAESGLAGIAHPHLPRLQDLIGYEYQKKMLCFNTEKFLGGLPANNVLLYGGSGTGKSTMIKALLEHYRGKPLRMVEVHRDSLPSLHHLAEILSGYNLKFVLFIDDLSFEDYETEYKGLKAVLEGSLQGQTGNMLIYATSNRRHLVKEFFHDRDHLDDEIHVHDTQQEKISLADRFGLTLSFAAPNQEEYLAIVQGLAQRQGLDIGAELLRRQALQWERGKHGPSGRTARQFINHIAGQVGEPGRLREF
ncbi:MAG TPA: hypothetical protein DER60_14755 [Syntrophomonas sp.]|jgi:hypothetical protein|nr:hypothetical protein [Syntrophomonas sp.]